ncbi:MAG TPA: hypothetical protein VNH45_00245 [Gaiellaceae bacterium]|nr:hypothetical protein [Gaiellaceae bacterium]
MAKQFGLVVVLLAGTLALTSGAASSRAACTTLVVAKGHYSTIQAAVNHAKPCDWVLVAPGVYPENVVIKTPNLHLRGLDRNRVIVDGRHRRGVNGIEVAKADNVWIENLTVRNFDLNPKTHEDGNEIWWNGGDESGKVGASGWYGNYLTSYDTGIHGSYGIFVSNSVHGAWDHVYASGFSDSGLYVGACPDCYGSVSHALVENNQMGFSGTNAGGHLIVQDSVFRHNGIGVGPNSLPNDEPPPQLGTCDSAKNTTPTPSITSTQVARCTIFRRNRIYDNNNLTTPANALVIQEGWGVGLYAIGTYGDLFRDNAIYGNKNFGILAIENPVPFPPTSATIYFQLEGNRFEHNTVRDGKYANIGMAGGIFGEKNSVNNCFTGNVYKTSLPSDLAPWSCANATTPNPDHDAATQILTDIVNMQSQSMARKQQAQPTPPAQPTMPHPCRGVPANPLCVK